MRTQELYVQLDGTIQTIGDATPDLEMIGPCTRRRASNILPVHRGKRGAFLFLRALFGERGRIAEWTRQWQGPWISLLFATGETYVHQSRRCCVEWERRRLAELMGAP